MTVEAVGSTPSIASQPRGWALFPAAADLMPGGAPALLAALQEERLKAFLLIRPRPNRGRRDDDDGKRFEISTRYWTTDKARQAMRGGWVQAPVLELHPRDPTATVHHEVNKGGYVLLEEKAIRARIAGEGLGQPPLDDEQRREKERELVAAKLHELFSEPIWTMDHALFWAATRDRQAMAEYFASAERAVFGATFRDMQFTVLVQHLNRHGIERRASLEDLVKAARHGAITIEGKKNSASEWTPIPSRDWAGGPSPGGLEISEDSVRGPYASEPEEPHRIVWKRLCVSRQQVMDAFPEHEPESTPSNADKALGAVVPNKAWQDAYVSASAWYKAVGMDEARKKLLYEGKTPSQATMAISAAERWNTDRPKDKHVKDVQPESLARSLRKRS